ncbi:MAG: ACT domain-containing protein [Ruminococcus sp.]|nr:ACT domain-containing protein [Ruminococcus sp.]MBQ4535161.1 ACT domain-containing protein [Ruminococcus sp.]MBR6791658.1 ACT domain-containing protein [Ruminococcus sp.]
MNNVRQISVFVENKPGRLSAITQILKDNGINIRALSIADTKDFGILRLIVNDPDMACQKLKDASCTVTITEVVAISIDDEMGKLSEVMSLINNAGVNIEYLYAFLSKSSNKASIILRVDDNEKAHQLFTEAGIVQLAEKDICEM